MIAEEMMYEKRRVDALHTELINTKVVEYKCVLYVEMEDWEKDNDTVSIFINYIFYSRFNDIGN